MINFDPGFMEYLDRLLSGPGIAEALPAEQPIYAEPVYEQPSYAEAAYVPGFSGYLERLSGGPGFSEALPETVAIPEATYAEPAPVYAPPTPQPVQEVPYVEPAPVYAPPTPQPVAAEPYVEPAPDAEFAARAKAAALRAYEDAAARSFGARGELSSDLEAINQLEDFDYSPEALQYLKDQQAAVTGYTGPYSLSSMDLHQTDPQTGAAMPYTSGYLEQAAARGDPMDRMYASFDPETGASATRSSNTIQFDPNAEYRVIDRSTGKVLHTGTGYEAGAKIAELTKGIYGEKGEQADWDVQRNDGGSWSSVRDQDPYMSGFGTFLKMALPALTGGTLAPLMGGGALGAGLATAAGSAGAGALMGDSLGDILKSAALSGVTAGALQGIMPAGPSGTPVNTAHTGIANAIGGASNAITVLGNLASSAAPSVAGGITNALTSAASNNYAPEPAPPPPAGGYGDIVVSGTPPANLAAGPGAIAPGFPSTLEGALSAAQPGPVNYADQQIVVEAQRPAPPPEPAAPLPVYAPPSGGPATQPIDEIVVEGAREPYTQPDYVAPPATLITPPGAGGSLAPDTTLTQPIDSALPKSGPSLQDIIDYLRLAGLGTSLLGGLFGGGGAQQGDRTISGAMGGLNPTFSAKLPGANIPGLGGGAASTPRTAADLSQQGLKTTQDWYRYGYGPEQSFFNYVPQGSPNTSRAYTGYAEGGFAVKGPGDGREDKIPAMLSDGEYVIDAETVALLGNGSNKAGADVLDQFRVNVRKHKGRELARGGFSVNAKRPEQYMAGGRA